MTFGQKLVNDWNTVSTQSKFWKCIFPFFPCLTDKWILIFFTINKKVQSGLKIWYTSGLEGIKLCSVLWAQKSCSKHEIQQFDWLIIESEYKNRAPKFYDCEARTLSNLHTILWDFGRICFIMSKTNFKIF